MEKNRFKQLFDNIPSSIKMKLDHIRDFMYLGQASAMIGAGFCKNAEKDETTFMKDWGQLADDFYEELYRKRPSDNDMRLKSPLKLASQIECTKGRVALDELIIKSLPDSKIRPGKIHHDLIKLKWCDIFTTNYDTLLERSASDVYKSYNVVTSKDTLLYKQSPRIVKLHGSFNESRPFIISEEDYRTYPQKFPEFVNTVRQALIETVVCLFGFSGDDPNFLSWIGWIRDIMGDKLAPIYLFSTEENIHESEVSLLHKRKIEIIKLYDIGNINSIQEGFDFVFSYLSEEFNTKIEWSGKLQIHYSDKSTNLEDITNKMKQIRNSYPGWLLLPKNKLSDFDDFDRLDFYFLKTKNSNLSNIEKINYLYELDWRFTISFMPIFLKKEYCTELENIIQKENKLEDKLLKKIQTLKCSLLSIYRQIGDDEKFNKLSEELNFELKNNTSILTRRIYYEKCLKTLGELDYKKTQSILADWDVNDLDYLGSIWKANVLIEIGKNEQGIMLLDNALKSVRKMLLTDSESAFLRSAFIILSNCISLYKHSKLISDSKDSIDLQFKDYVSYIKEKITTKEETTQTHITHDFNMGNYIRHWKLGGYKKNNRKQIESFRYLILCENYGYSLGMPKIIFFSDLQEMIFSYIVQDNMYYALTSMIRSSNNKIFDIVCSRKYISPLSQQKATIIFEQYFNIWNTIDNQSVPNEQIYRFKNIVFPLLSRLCVKIDSKYIVEFIKTYICFTEDLNYNAKYLINAYNCLSKDDLIQVANIIYSTPINLNVRQKEIPLPDIDNCNFEITNNMIEIIDNGIHNSNKSIRDAAYYRMTKLYQLASDKHKDEFNTFLQRWRLDYKNDINILYSFRLQYPHDVNCPEGANQTLEAKFTEFINGKSSNPIENFIRNLDHLTNFIDWLNIEQIHEITKKILLFLKDNLEIINNKDYNLFVENPIHIISIFCVKIKNGQLNDEEANALLDYLFNYSNEYYCTSAITNLLYISNQLTTKRDKLNKIINNNILSKDKYRIKDSFMALILLYKKLGKRARIQEFMYIIIEN